MYLFYTFKAIEIQERLLCESFNELYRKYLDASIILYNGNEYQKSIEFATKSLEHSKNFKFSIDTSIYINVYDILGSNYLQINNIELAKENYLLGNEKLQQLSLRKDFKDLWQSIYIGNLGRIDFLEGNIDEAYSKILIHHNKAIEYNDSLNLCISGNRLGDIYFERNQIQKAETEYLKVMKIAEVLKYHEHAIYAAKKLIDISLLRNDYKKAFYYENLSDTYTQSHQIYLDNVSLNRLQALLNIESTKVELEKSKNALQFERNKRMNLTYFFVFIAIIIITIFLRMKMRNKHRLLMKENESLAMEMSYVNEQISNFKKNIIEKNN